MENGVPNNTISTDDFISKLKDDGDFDRLRLKIIREAKDNEDLRSSIISMVKQSTALNRPGAENMKPRQLSDAIHQEVGEKVMSQISESVWNIIRSEDGMKREIKETVESVYYKLLNPNIIADNKASSSNRSIPVQMHVTPEEVDGALDEPPGFCLQTHDQTNLIPKECANKTMGQDLTNEEQRKEANDYTTCMAPPTLPTDKMQCDGNDDDPDVPPGFG